MKVTPILPVGLVEVDHGGDDKADRGRGRARRLRGATGHTDRAWISEIIAKTAR